MSDIKIGDRASVNITGEIVSILITAAGTTAVLRYGTIWDEVRVNIEQLKKEDSKGVEQ